MKKAMLATVLALSLSAAWAVDWDVDDDFAVLSDDGRVVGQGELDEDTLELELLSGYTGFVRFDAGGEVVEGMINADGTITLINASGFVELDDDLAAKGYSLVVTPVDTVSAPANSVVSPTDPTRDATGDDGNDNSSGTGGSDDAMSGDDDNGDNSSSGDDVSYGSDDDSGSFGSPDTSSDDDDNDDDNNVDSGDSTNASNDDDNNNGDSDDN
jgi:hypothetical protein